MKFAFNGRQSLSFKEHFNFVEFESKHIIFKISRWQSILKTTLISVSTIESHLNLLIYLPTLFVEYNDKFVFYYFAKFHKFLFNLTLCYYLHCH